MKAFFAIKLIQNYLVSIQDLLQNITKRNVTTSSGKVDFCSVTCFRFEAETPNSMFINHDLNYLLSEINSSHIGSCNKDNTSEKVSGEFAMKGIEDLLPYIPAVYRPYYVSVLESQ
jgi:hypothetical protein